jgi:hypothetical protein
MPRQYVLECLIDLPDDPHEMSEAVSKTKEPTSALKSALDNAGIKYQLTSEIRSKVVRRKKDLPGTLLAESKPAEAAE